MFNFNFTYYRLAPSARQTSVPSVSAISLTLSVGPSKCRCTLLSAKPTEGMELSSYTEADKTGARIDAGIRRKAQCRCRESRHITSVACRACKRNQCDHWLNDSGDCNMVYQGDRDENEMHAMR